MDETTLIVALFALAVGLSIALIAWLLSQAVADVPAEDREYKDPPPLVLRIVWWPIQWISHYLGACISAKRHAAAQHTLRKAGLDYCLSPAQFLAARLICTTLVILLASWLLDSFNHPGDGKPGLSNVVYWQIIAGAALLGWIYPSIWLRDRLMARRRQILKAIPFYLDIVTLCVEAGLNLQGAVNQAVLKGPKGVLRDEFQRVLRDIRAGKPRAESLRSMANRVNEPGVTNFVAAIIQAERMGMSLGPVLRAQADQQRIERFLRAEKLAMEAPVKMLFPLIAFIFPCTFIVLFFPIVIKFMEAGI